MAPSPVPTIRIVAPDTLGRAYRQVDSDIVMRTLFGLGL